MCIEVEVACSCILSPDYIPRPLLAAHLAGTWTIKRKISLTRFGTFKQNVMNIISCKV